MAHNLEQKFKEADYFFQTIEMASDEPPPTQNHNTYHNELEGDYFSWKVVKRRQKPQRRYTVSHGAPPAPPSTPTSLSKEHEPLLSPNSNNLSPASLTDSTNSGGNNHHHHHHVAAAAAAAVVNVDAADSDTERLKYLYTLDYTPKFKKKLKEQDRTAAELAELFKVVTITGGHNGHEPIMKTAPEHGVSFASRQIRRELNVGSFKLYRKPLENTTTHHDLYDEDSQSAPEFSRENYVEHRRRRSHATRGPRSKTRRKLLVKHFELMEHMDEIADSFDAAVSIRPAQ